MGLCSSPWELRNDILYIQNGVYMNEISILKYEFSRIKVSKWGGCGNESHIGRKTVPMWVYRLESMIGLQACIYGFTPTHTIVSLKQGQCSPTNILV